MKNKSKHFYICKENTGNEVSLIRKKIYLSLPDSEAEKESQIRIVDETGEDYLFPKKWFLEIEVPKKIEKVLLEV